jgi:hypothetical protein
VALAYTHQTLVNANGNPQTTGVISPASGGVLLAKVQGATAGGTWAFTGSLGGTWTRAVTMTSASDAREHAVYYCSDYGASGTVTITASAGTFIAATITLVKEAGVLNTVSPIKQTKAVDATTPVSVAWNTAPTYGCWFGVAPSNAPTAGTGWTQMAAASFAFDGIWSCQSATGANPIAFTLSSGPAAGLIAVELNTVSLAHPFKFGWRR